MHPPGTATSLSLLGGLSERAKRHRSGLVGRLEAAHSSSEPLLYVVSMDIGVGGSASMSRGGTTSKSKIGSFRGCRLV